MTNLKKEIEKEIMIKQICMCGHLIDEHIEQIEGKARAGECSKCNCHYFCQRDEIIKMFKENNPNLKFESKAVKELLEQAILSQKQEIIKLLDKCFTRNDINELIDKLEKGILI